MDSEESIKGVKLNKRNIIEAVLYVPKSLRGSSVRTQMVAGRTIRNWRSLGSTTRAYYYYMNL